MIYAESETIFRLHATLASRVRDLKEHRTGLLRIMATPPLGYSVVPHALNRFLNRHSKIKLFFDVRSYENVLTAVEEGQAELGFVMGLRQTPPLLESELLFEGAMVCVMKRNHPLSRQSVIRPHHFRSERFIALEHGTRMGTLLRNAFSEVGEPFSYSVEVRYANSACVLAEYGVGLAVVDPLSAKYGHYPSLVTVNFEPKTIVTASFVKSRKRPLSDAAEAFLRDMRLSSLEAAKVINKNKREKSEV